MKDAEEEERKNDEADCFGACYDWPVNFVSLAAGLA
jgi:hypothetical protein